MRDCEVEGGVGELRSRGVNAVHINQDGSLMLINDGSEAAGKWVEMKESRGEGAFEAVKKSGHKRVSIFEGLGGFAKEKTLLDVLDGKEVKIPMAQVMGLL